MKLTIETPPPAGHAYADGAADGLVGKPTKVRSHDGTRYDATITAATIRNGMLLLTVDTGASEFDILPDGWDRGLSVSLNPHER